jgi:hypothetical protein
LVDVSGINSDKICSTDVAPGVATGTEAAFSLAVLLEEVAPEEPPAIKYSVPLLV